MLAMKKEYKGTGEELSIIKKVVENYNGKILVEVNLVKELIFKFTCP